MSEPAPPGAVGATPAPVRTPSAGVLAAHPEGVVLSLVVTPRAGKTAIARLDGDALRLRVAAPPVDGAANAAVVRFLADLLGVPGGSVRILSGAKSRRKRVLIEGCSIERAAATLLD